MSVLATPKVLEYIERLVPTLYENGYFSYEEDARKYVKDLYDDIKNSLSTRLHKPAPKYFDKYGKNMKYAVFKKNRRTTWYVFFKTYNKDGETILLVRYIANNHSVAQHL